MKHHGNSKKYEQEGQYIMDNNKTLGQVTDDPRVSTDPREYERVRRDLMFYQDNWPKIEYINSYKQRTKRHRYTLNMTKKAARRLASIIFNEKCTVTVGSRANEGDGTDPQKQANADKVNDYIARTLQDNDFGNSYEEALECAIATGSMVQRPYVGTDGTVKIAFARADQIFPLQSNTNHVEEICIASRTVKSAGKINQYYTLLEFHQWQNGNYVITNELYKSNDEQTVGTQVPLAEIYPEMNEQTTISGVKFPLFAFFKTAGANNKSLESPLGIGIVDNSLDTLRAINDTYDAFHWELVNGRRRIIVPDTMTRFDDKHKPTFDEKTDVYLSSNSDDDEKPQDITADLRVDNFTQTLASYLRTFEMEIGLSSGTFAYNSGTAQITATQVISENSTTYQTRSSYLTMAEQNIISLVRAIVQVSTVPEMFPNGQTPLDPSVVDLDDLDITVHFDDGVFTDRQSQANYIIGLQTAGIVPKWYAIQKIMDIPESDAREWAKEIAQETGEGMADTTAGSEAGSGYDPLNDK